MLKIFLRGIYQCSSKSSVVGEECDALLLCFATCYSESIINIQLQSPSLDNNMFLLNRCTCGTHDFVETRPEQFTTLSPQVPGGCHVILANVQRTGSVSVLREVIAVSGGRRERHIWTRGSAVGFGHVCSRGNKRSIVNACKHGEIRSTCDQRRITTEAGVPCRTRTALACPSARPLISSVQDRSVEIATAVLS